MNEILLNSFLDLPVSDEDRKRIKRSCRRMKIKKGEVLFRQGEVCPHIFFLHSGLIKLSYLTLEGREFIKSFVSEGDIFGSLYSQVTGEGSTFSAIALEDVEVESMPYSLLQELVANHQTMQHFAISLFQRLALKKEMREYEFLCMSAQDRYKKICENNEILMARIKQSDLALYLGITPIALSRMKHRDKKIVEP